MAKMDYQIPSLLKLAIWSVHFDGSKTKWEQLWRPWHNENLIGGTAEPNRDLVIGQSETIGGNAKPKTFALPIARSATHHERPHVANFHRSVYQMWGFAGNHSAVLRYGIHKSSFGPGHWLMLLPAQTNLGGNDYAEFPHAAGLAPNRLEEQVRPFYFESHAFFHVLETASAQGPQQPWYLLSRTASQQGSPTASVSEPLIAFDALNLALRETRGTQFSARPFHGLVPSLHPVGKDFDPLSLTALLDRSTNTARSWGTRLLRIELGDQARDKELDARFDWYYSARDGSSDAKTGFTLRGKIRNDGSAQFNRRWSNDATEVFRTFDAMLKDWNGDKSIENTKEWNADRTIVAFALDRCKVLDPGWLRMGSHEIEPQAAQDGCMLTFSASGHLGTGATAIYPNVKLTNLKCKVRNAAGSDSERELAGTDDASDEIDLLRRETTPIVRRIDDASHRDALLTIVTQYQPGRDAVTRMTLDVDMSGAQQGSAFWMNLRPFMAALVDYAESDNARMTITWTSDDPDGAQWRVNDAVVSVVFPPQAVGEEMERGDRFYDVIGTPDILPKVPVPHRFSRATHLKLKPSPGVENRRFEVSPINLREIMRGSTIEHMIVEMAYPLEVEYDRKDKSRELRLVEAGEYFGAPAPTLAKDGRDEGDGLSEALKPFMRALPAAAKSAYLGALGLLQERQLGVQVNFQSRLAELHVHDPLRARNDLRLGGADVVSRLRNKTRGAPAILNPLPNDATYKPEPRPGSHYEQFLENGEWGDAKKESLRAGLVHSFEYVSEMEGVLYNPTAVGTMIEALTLSALGATGRMEASFDNGKTSFAVVVEHGQLSRLVKTRIGRIGALWNCAKHVVVYERSAARSAQFKDEQKHTSAFDRWPILRKLEEYVEPIEDRREFNKEAQKDSNTTRFVQASVFDSKRIYVNGAWGRDLGPSQGYELPLWDRTSSRSNPGFYPRPRIFLDCYGEEGRMTRLWFRDPDRIFFFSSAEEGTTDDTDKWNQRAGVDFDNLPRMPVMETATAQAQGMEPRQPASSDLCTSLRFDLAVEAEGSVDLTYGSGSAPQFVKINRVSISRSSQSAPVPLAEVMKEPGLTEAIVAVAHAGTAQKSAARLAPDLASLSVELRERIEKQIYEFKDVLANPCQAITQPLKDLVTERIEKFRKLLDPFENIGLAEQILRTRAMWLAAAGELNAQLESRALLNERVVEERAAALVDGLDKLYAVFLDNPNPLPAEVKKQRDALVSDIGRFKSDLVDRVDNQLAKVSEDIRSALEKAVIAVDAAVTALSDSGYDFEEKCRDGCANLAEAVGQLEKLPTSTRKLVDSATNWLRFLSDQLATLADQADYLTQLAAPTADEIVKKLTALVSAVRVVANAICDWAVGQLDAASDTVVAEIQAIATDIATDLTSLSNAATGTEARAAIEKLRRLIQGTEASVTARHRRAANLLSTKLLDAANGIADALLPVSKTSPLKAVADACKEASAALGTITTQLTVRLHAVIDQGATQCNQFVETIQKELDKAEQWARRQADAALTEVLSSEAGQRMAHYAQTASEVWDVGGKAVSLARAVGELPNLHPLKFDIDVAAYVFEGKKPEIMMTPAIARLQEEGEALLESLGLSIPCKELRDRIVPDFADFDFNQVFNKFAGMDLRGLFEKFKLPALDSDKVKVSHGFDPKTRRAWANAKVDFAHPPYEDLFSFGAVALGLQKMKFDAFAGIETNIVGTTVKTPKSKITASLRADWLLQGAGQALVTFRDVAINYDGADGFDFDVSPENIELHPSLKFITEIVEKLQGTLPPAVQIEMKNGRPVGVSAGTTVVVDNPPDLGAVSIGPIDIRSSLALSVAEGRFSIQSAFSLGSKQKPIFVQITWLGGGCWLEARAKYVDGRVMPSISIGLSVGATRAFNLASVAKGSFSVLLYCYIEIERDNDSVAVGLSIVGSALIIGFVNANVSLLLEAKHSGGSTEGTGRLDVSVKISWFYTFRFKQAVKHKF